MTSVCAPETDVGPSVMKPAVRQAESPFLVEVQEYRSRRSAVERLFRASPPRTPVSPENRSQCHCWPATGHIRLPPTPSCCGADVLEGDHVIAGVGQAERAEEHVCPCAVDSPGPPGSPPVQRAGGKEPRQPAVQPGLAPVA